MANFDAIRIDSEFAGYDFVDKQEHQFVDPVFEVKLAEVTGNNKTLMKTNFGSIISGDVSEAWFDNIFVEPLSIDFEFIIDDTSVDITLFSTYRRHEDSKTISLFNEINFDGLQSLNVVTPKQVTPQCDELFTLIATKDGPAQQSSQIVIQIGGDTFNILISGSRVSLFPFDVNWATNYVLGLIFKTVIHQTSEFVEQRRSLEKTARHRASFDMRFKTARYRNLLRDLSKKTVGMPWHNEFINVTAITNDAINDNATISTSTDLSELVFLPIAKFLCFIDEDNVENNEVVEIESFTSSEIIAKKQVDFTAQNICCFPVYLATIRVQENFRTTTISDYKIIAEEL